MPEATRVSVEVGGTEISFETGKLAKQASGSVLVASGLVQLLAPLSVTLANVMVFAGMSFLLPLIGSASAPLSLCSTSRPTTSST